MNSRRRFRIKIQLTVRRTAGERYQNQDTYASVRIPGYAFQRRLRAAPVIGALPHFATLTSSWNCLTPPTKMWRRRFPSDYILFQSFPKKQEFWNTVGHFGIITNDCFQDLINWFCWLLVKLQLVNLIKKVQGYDLSVDV